MAIEGGGHELGLQMVHDQLAAAGFHTIFETGVAPDRIASGVESEYPDVLVIGSVPELGAERAATTLAELRASHPDLPVVLACPAVGGQQPSESTGMTVLERIDESVPAVERLLATPASAASV